MNNIPRDCILEIFGYLDITDSYNFYNCLENISFDNLLKIEHISFKEIIKVINHTKILSFVLKFTKHIQKKHIERYIIIYGTPYTIINLINNNIFKLTSYNYNYLIKHKGYNIIDRWVKHIR